MDKYFLGLKKLTSRKYSCENGTAVCQETNNFSIRDHHTFNESKLSTSLSIFIPFGINVNVISVCVVFSLMLLKYFSCIGQFVKPSPVQTWCLSTRSCKSEKDCVVFRLYVQRYCTVHICSILRCQMAFRNAKTVNNVSQNRR